MHDLLYCTVLHSTAQYCTVLQQQHYSTVRQTRLISGWYARGCALTGISIFFPRLQALLLEAEALNLVEVYASLVAPKTNKRSTVLADIDSREQCCTVLFSPATRGSMGPRIQVAPHEYNNWYQQKLLFLSLFFFFFFHWMCQVWHIIQCCTVQYLHG